MADRDETARAENAEATAADAAADAGEDVQPEPTFPESVLPVVELVREHYPDVALSMRADGWLEAKIGPDKSPQFFAFLKETPGLAFDYLSDITAVDYEDKGFQVVYHLIAIGVQAKNTNRKIVVKLDVPRDKPHAPTVVDIWPTANFLEREVYDLMGVAFDGHPDLRRILMREDWVGHPLRKDYVDRRPPRPRVVSKSPGRS